MVPFSKINIFKEGLMNTLICYKKCTTCKAVEKLMKDQAIDYGIREIDKDNPTKD